MSLSLSDYGKLHLSSTNYTAQDPTTTDSAAHAAAAQLVPRTTMTDPNNAAAPIGEVAVIMGLPTAHRIAQPPPVQHSYATAGAAQHRPSSTHRPIRSPYPSASAVQFNPASMRSRPVRFAASVPRDLSEPS